MSGVSRPAGTPRVSRWAVLAAATLALGLPFALGGCSFDVQVGPNSSDSSAAPASPAGSVGKDELARKLSDELARKTGQRPELITCPNDLPGAAGASVRCDLLQGGKRVGTITATVNDQGRISYNYDVAVPPPPSPAPGPGQ